MNKEYILALENLTKKIEKNQADINDYQKYEDILLKGGLPKSIIDQSLKDAGFETWIDFVSARQDKEKEKNIESAVIGGLIGLGLGLLIAALFDRN